MPAPRQSHWSFDAAFFAEWAFLCMLIWLIAGPLSGAVLTGNALFSSIFTKSAREVKSTRNLAEQLLASSSRIKTLETKLAEAELTIAKLQQQSKDANKLRALLDLKTHADRIAIAADIVSRNPDNWFEQVVIDKGALDHVVLGSAVITNEGVVGQVVSVSERASVVRLLTDPDQKIGVLIQRPGLTGVLSGRHQNPAVIEFVPIGTNVDVKDKVVCLGKSGTFPENHPVGTVIGVRRDQNGTTAQIEVRLAENCYDLTEVLVLPPLEP